jgi:hypothetical protein
LKDVRQRAASAIDRSIELIGSGWESKGDAVCAHSVPLGGSSFSEYSNHF